MLETVWVEVLRLVTDETHSHAAAVVSWATVAVYTVLAQVAAVFSVIEIGPNLLALGTSLIGAVVLLGQLYLASKVKHVESKADSNREQLKHVRKRVEKVEQEGNGQ